MDAKAAGKGKVTCSVCTPEGAELDVDVVENEDGTFDIFYTAPQPGEYVICVRFGGEHIPNSPFQVTVSEYKFTFIQLAENNSPLSSLVEMKRKSRTNNITQTERLPVLS